MHFEVINFCTSQVKRFTEQGLITTKPNVLDCGSYDINGNNRYLFPNAKSYTGIDIVNGANVDVVTRVKDFHPGIKYDIVISTEMLEHDEQWKESIRNMVGLLKPGGLLLLTAAGTDRKEHGTDNNVPSDSPLTHNWYKNIDPVMLKEAIMGYQFRFITLGIAKYDIYFSGIKI